MNPIPFRHYYSIAETAQLTGMSETFIRDGVQKSRRKNPPADAIPFRMFGTQIRIPRAWIFPDEPANVTPLHAGLTDAQLDAALDRMWVRLAGRLAPATNERRIAS